MSLCFVPELKNKPPSANGNASPVLAPVHGIVISAHPLYWWRGLCYDRRIGLRRANRSAATPPTDPSKRRKAGSLLARTDGETPCPLYVARYYFCRVHEALRITPAMQLGVADHIWTIGELVDPALSGILPEAAVGQHPRFTQSS